MSKLTIKEIREELSREFSYISNYDMLRLFDYVFKQKFSLKLNEKRVNENEELDSKLRMFVRQIVEKATDSDLADIYMFWKCGKKNTKSLFEALDKEKLEQDTKFESAVKTIIDKVDGKASHVTYNIDDSQRILTIELHEEGGSFMDTVEFLYDEFLDKEFNQNGDWKLMAKQGNIIVLVYNPEVSEVDIKVPEKIKYDPEREKMSAGTKK